MKSFKKDALTTSNKLRIEYAVRAKINELNGAIKH